MADNQTKNSKFFDEGKGLSELFNEAISLRGLDVKKLSELTDIPVHYLAALSDGDFAKLPAVPYVRGYLIKAAEVLRMDADLLLRAYKQEVSFRALKTSGAEDKLPSNRFTLGTPSRKRTFIIIGIILVLAIIYFIWQIDNFFGTPKIQIFSPAADNLIVNSPSIKLSGEVSSRDKLTVNGEEILVEKNGQFKKDFSLQSGINTIEFKAKRFLGREIKVIRQVICQP